VDISLERVQLPGVAAADGVDPLRDGARGLDDSIAVVTDCLSTGHECSAAARQVAIGARIPFPNKASGCESCVEDAMAAPAASGKPLS
jgi:hypothetical protein